jgi:hypothetical protein
MAKIQIGKTTASPGTPLNDALYLIKAGGDTKFKLRATTPAGSWVDLDAVTGNELVTALLGKENSITAGTTSQYWRGDKTWQALDKVAVGLGNVDNTSDVNKPVSTAQATINALKANDADVLHKIGNETKTSGILTFAVSPVVPNATTAGQAAAYGQVTAGDGALQTQIDALTSSVNNGMKVAQPLDCSTNPNYPASTKGDAWRVTAPGKIGGASGVNVNVNDTIVCLTTTVAGTHAAVGANFYIQEGNQDAATETVSGWIRKATQAEAEAGTSDVGAMTPLRTAQQGALRYARFDASQALTEPQKLQARTNIGAASSTAVAGTTGNFAAFTSANAVGDSLLSWTGITVRANGVFNSNTPPSAVSPTGLAMGNAGNFRWAVGKIGLESGVDNNGSDLSFMRYNDAGTSLGSALLISRATGNATFSGRVSGAEPVNNTDFVTKLYADTIANSVNWFATDW